MSFDLGRVLGCTFSVFFRGFFKIFALTTIIYIPYLILALVAVLENPEFGEDLSQTPGYALGLWGLSFFLGPMVTAAVIFEVLNRLRGSSATLGKSMHVAVLKLLPVLVVNLFFHIAVGIGLVLLIIPGLIFMSALCAAVPCCVMERVSIVGCFDRSWRLTQGCRMRILGALLVLWLVGGSLALLANMAPAALTMAGGSGFVLAIVFTVTQLVTLLGAALNSVGQAVIYHELRTVKEGADADQLVAVFS